MSVEDLGFSKMCQQGMIDQAKWQIPSLVGLALGIFALFPKSRSLSVEAVDERLVPVYDQEELEELQRRYGEIQKVIAEGRLSNRPVNIPLLQDLHRSLFEGIRGHAGRIRQKGFGSERLTFGPYRSAARQDVERELSSIFSRTGRQLEETPRTTLEAAKVAALAHADIVLVHPFEDGNGRISRLAANVILVKLGQKPVAIEPVKPRYIAALDTYFKSSEVGPLSNILAMLSRANENEPVEMKLEAS